MPPKRLGIFGGTFDPPHLGHLILASEAQRCLTLEQVLWVLTPYPPHKPKRQVTRLDDRLDMLRIAIAGNLGFVLSTVEIDRPPPHYAVDTVALLKQAYPGAELVYLMGGDSLRDLPGWHTPQEFVSQCDLIGVMRRPGARHHMVRLEENLPGISQKVVFVTTPLVEISSSAIRQRISNDESIRYFVPDGVGEIIRQRKLYTNLSHTG